MTFRKAGIRAREGAQLRLPLMASGRVSKGAFPAIGSNATGNQDRKRGHDGSNQSDQNNKRLRGNDRNNTGNNKNNTSATQGKVQGGNERSANQPKCAACWNRHLTSNCVYLFPHLAPEGFEMRDHARERVEKNLAANPTLREEALNASKPKDN